jgi:hypothetical protein
MSSTSNMPVTGGFAPLTSRGKQVSQKKMSLMERIYCLRSLVDCSSPSSTSSA